MVRAAKISSILPIIPSLQEKDIKNSERITICEHFLFCSSSIYSRRFRMTDHVLHLDLLQKYFHVSFQDHKIMDRIPVLIMNIISTEYSDEIRRVDQILLKKIPAC